MKEQYRIPIIYGVEVDFVYEWAASQVEAIEKVGLARGEVILEERIEVMS